MSSGRIPRCSSKAQSTSATTSSRSTRRASAVARRATTLLAGAVVNFTGRLTGEISAGWGQQQSVDDRLSRRSKGRSSTPISSGCRSPLTKLEFIARSEIDETSLTDSLGAIDHYYDLSLQHAFWRYLVLGTYVSYEIADYVDDPLVDQRLKTGLTGRVLLQSLCVGLWALRVYGFLLDRFRRTTSSRTRCGSAVQTMPSLA